MSDPSALAFTTRSALICAAGLTLAAITGLSAISQVIPSTSVSAFAMFSGNDGKSLGRRFDAALQKSRGALSDPGRWLASAKQSLAVNPLDRVALRVAGLSSLLAEKNLPKARGLMLGSERVSGRDLSTQLWLLEDAVSRDNIPEVLQHYDRALSVHPETYATLFPILSGALEDNAIRAEVVPYVRADRGWQYEFVGYAIDNAPEPNDVADLLARAGGSRSVPRNRPLETKLLGKLVENRRFNTALRYVEFMAPKSAQQLLSQFGFSKVTADAELRPLSWSFVEDLVIETDFNEETGLSVRARSGLVGVAADRVMLLSPGRWRITYSVSMPRLAPTPEATWTATCLADGTGVPFWKQSVPQQPGRFDYGAVLDIPVNCGATRFRLRVRGADVQEDSSMTVHKVGLVRA